MIRDLPRLAALIAGLWLASALPAGAAPPFANSPFADWALVVVAGDDRAHNGKPSEVFDNARRDVAAAFVRAGFDPAHLQQYSVRPQRYRAARAGPSDVDSIYLGLEKLAAQTRSGCLVYFSSHGDPEGILVGQDILTPDVLAMMLDQTCGQRPTIAVISACFSGVFVPALAAPHRMVLTAARPDRASFGCGESETYPYFDDCFLSSLTSARDFAALADRVKSCVARRETAEGASPPSEPQVHIGAGLKPLIPLLTLADREGTD